MVEAYREGKKTKHKSLLYFGAVDDDTIEKLKMIYDPNATIVNAKNIACESSVSYGSYYLVDTILNELGLKAAFENSFKDVNVEKWKNHISMSTALSYIKAMIMQRIIQPDSKKSLIEWQESTPLKYFTNIEQMDLQTAYVSLEVLAENFNVVESYLYEWAVVKYNQPKSELYYDITSTYFDGHSCILADYGYSRDHRRDKVQVVVGLVTTKDGFPIKCKIYKGNTADKTTVTQIVSELKALYSINEVIFVGDRGMLTEKNIKEIKNAEQKYIMAIPRGWTKKYLKDFDINENSMTMVKESLYCRMVDCKPDEDSLLLCLNTQKREDDNNYRVKHMEKIADNLAKLNESLAKAKKVKTSEEIMKKVGALLKLNQAGKYYIVEIKESGNKAGYSLNIKLDDEKLQSDRRLDGTFLIRTNKCCCDEVKLIETYKNLRMVENAFRVIKNDLDVRPIYHYSTRRVEGHIYLCVLSYFIYNSIECQSQKLNLNKSARSILDILEKINLVSLSLGSDKTKTLLTNISPEQLNLLHAFGIYYLTTPNVV